MEEFKIIIKGHSADLKTQATGSKDTGIFCPPELVSFLGESSDLSFTIYKEDCMNAMSEMVTSLPLYANKGGRIIVHDNVYDECVRYIKLIDDFFQSTDKAVYSGITMTNTTGDRHYLYNLDQNGFSIRKFLVADHSEVIFRKDDNDNFEIRFKTTIADATKADTAPVIVEERNLTSFVLSIIQYFDKKDHLDSIKPYSSTTPLIKVSKNGVFSLTGMFIESTLEDIKERNTPHARWFENPFKLGERDVYLSNQWNSQGEYPLTLDDFIMMINVCYGNNYQYRFGVNGLHQLVLLKESEYYYQGERPLQQIFYGTPGSGKSRKVKKIIEGIYPNKEERDRYVFRTTFHPDSDYSSFVGCYKPRMEGEKIKYDYVPQAFTNAYVRAWQESEKEIYLVIEEINRGNCAQIFGDLFQLLDRNKGVSEYPINADADLKQFLEIVLGQKHEGIKEGKLKLPANFHILATMNTSDQSLFPMDSAFKRRWTWECVPIDYNNEESSKFKITIGDQKYSWNDFLKEVNKRIFDTTDSEDKQMGNFFINDDVDEIQFIDKVMFYLWNDICKEEYHTSKNFFRKKTDKSADDNSEFSFNSLFETEKTSECLIQFMEYLGVKPVD